LPLRQFSPSLIQRFLLTFLLIQLKPKHYRLDVLTIFQRGACGVCGARGAVFRDTPDSKMGYGGEVHHPTILGLGLGLGRFDGELRVGSGLGLGLVSWVVNFTSARKMLHRPP